MKQSVRTLLVGMAVAFFFMLTLGALAQEKAAPPATPAPATPPPAVEPATPTPATPATPAPEAAPTAPAAAPTATPATEAATPAAPPTTAPAPTEMRRLDEPVQVEKPSDKGPKTKKSRSQIMKERADKMRQRIEEKHEHQTGDQVVNVFSDSHLEAGHKADVVVAVFGNAIAEGEVADAVVSVLGDNRVTGPAVHGGTVAVLGNSYIDCPVTEDVVVVLGNLELGPNARIGGELVCVGGTIKRDPAATVAGTTTNVGATSLPALPALRAWFDECFKKARPLAFGHNLGWAWGIAAVFLALYVFGALVFRSGAEKCVKTLEISPGFSVLSALLVTLITPVLMVVLVMTGVGIAVVPIIGIGLLCVTFFGKMVVLAWLGRRFTRFFGDGPLGHIAFAVLVGGVIVAVLYTVPVLGALLYKFTGWLGMGVVVYTIAQGMKRDKVAPLAPAPAATYATAAVAPVYTPAPAPMTTGLDPTMPANPAPMPSDGPMASPGFVGAAAMPAAPMPDVTAPGAGAIPAEPTGVPPMWQSQTMPPPPRPFSTPAMASAAGMPLPPPIYTASTLPRAGFWIRLGAMALDFCLVAVVLGGFLHQGARGVFVVVAIYAAVMWKMKGTTIGGVICGLKVVRIDDRPIDWLTSSVRALGCFLSLAIMGFGFIWVAFDNDKQSWHDKIAGTTVVKMPKGVSLL